MATNSSDINQQISNTKAICASINLVAKKLSAIEQRLANIEKALKGKSEK